MTTSPSTPSTPRMPRQLRRRILRGLSQNLLRQVLGTAVSRRIVRIGSRAYANGADQINAGNPRVTGRYRGVVLNAQLLEWLTARTQRIYEGASDRGTT